MEIFFRRARPGARVAARSGRLTMSGLAAEGETMDSARVVGRHRWERGTVRRGPGAVHRQRNHGGAARSSGTGPAWARQGIYSFIGLDHGGPAPMSGRRIRTAARGL